VFVRHRLILAGRSRLSDRSVLVLTSLAAGEKHGYALIKDVEAFGGVVLGPGTLYGALARLERQGLVEAMPASERRHPYRITASGRERLREHLAESARLVALGLERLATENP
jgi:DNA-binding PadR family transcriptional regulator